MLGLHPGDHTLVIAPHPDDETLGPGGTIAALTRQGITVDVLAVTCTTTPLGERAATPAERAREFDAACTVLGVRNRRIAWIDTPAARNPSGHMHELVALIETNDGPSLATSQPALLLIPAAEAHHQDHRAVHDAALAAVRPGHRGERPLPRIVAGYDGPEDQTWRAADAARPLLIDTTTVAEAKYKALRCYPTQLCEAPHPRSLDVVAALDTATGAAAGVVVAERFALYRMVA